MTPAESLRERIYLVRNQGQEVTYVAMPRLPNSDRAIVDLRKIEDYCLSPVHPRGRHKARVFREALNLDRSDARWLRNRLLDATASEQAGRLGKPLALGRTD